MQAILVLIFIILWKINVSICDYFYDYENQFSEWYYLRCDIYEIMFLIALLIPWFKTTVLSKTFIVLGLVMTAISVFYKLVLNEHTVNNTFFYLVVPMASSIAYLYYHKRIK